MVSYRWAQRFIVKLWVAQAKVLAPGQDQIETTREWGGKPKVTPTTHFTSTMCPSNESIVPVQSAAAWEWLASIRLKVQEPTGSLAICLFFGEAPEDPQTWHSAPNIVGMHGRYGDELYGGNGVTRGCLPLNNAIKRLSGLPSFDPEFVVPYLKEKLQWKVQRVSCHKIFFSKS